MTKPRDLYQMFRDCVLEDASKHAGFSFDVWASLPLVNIGRVQTVALLRKFMAQMMREYPKGVVRVKQKFSVTPELGQFFKTHQEMGTSKEDMVAAWKAMQDMQ